jgi:tetratricopeptide (TPR) repeat protein
MIFAFFVLIAIGAWTVYVTTSAEEQAEELVTKRVGDRLQRLWDDAFQSLKENKFLRAERALLTILKFDERNASAYNRLGILYAKQRSFEHAVECFEIAHSLEPNASTLHNLGLVYMEIGELQKAAHTMESAMEEEDEVPVRYIAYAKVQEKLGNEKRMVEALEHAAKLQPNRQTYTLVADAYKKVGRDEDAKKIDTAMKRAKTRIQKAPKIKQPRKVVM